MAAMDAPTLRRTWAPFAALGFDGVSLFATHILQHPSPLAAAYVHLWAPCLCVSARISRTVIEARVLRSSAALRNGTLTWWPRSCAAVETTYVGHRARAATLSTRRAPHRGPHSLCS
ncbi:hypothetical protein EON67_06400 [archaeon]|nr:MAG: hypothetical protein EON67_06400 [archaeon]